MLVKTWLGSTTLINREATNENRYDTGETVYPDWVIVVCVLLSVLNVRTGQHNTLKRMFLMVFSTTFLQIM